MTSLINYRLRITLSDSRTLTGQMLAFDKHMNLVLADCEEFRKIKPKSKKAEQDELEQKRTLGLVILRGETIISISVDGPPPPQANESKLRGPTMAAGMGIGRVSNPWDGIHIYTRYSLWLSFISLQVVAFLLLPLQVLQ